MSADSPRRSSGGRGIAVPAIVPPQVVSDRSILDSAIGFINDVTLAHQPHTDPKDTITWARFECAADISDPRFGEDWELEGNVAPPLLLILGYGLGVQVWAIPANGEAVEVLSWRHGIVSALRVLPTPITSDCMEDNGRADEPIDAYVEKRPLIALVDGSTAVGSQPQFCSVNFVSLKTGTQVKAIKFKNPVLDVLANRSSVVIIFHERIAVFDARTLEDRLSVTTCYPSPGINPNPVALGPRWLAYAEHKLLPSKRSAGGCDGEGVASYTATVLNAAKSFGKGLRELGEHVAAGLTGTTGSGSTSKNNSFDSGSGTDARQAGVITVLDIKNPIKDYSPTSGTPMGGNAGNDPIVAHFVAHSEAIVGVEFDNSGMLLITADRRGHDFHVFRIQPHPVGSSLAAVHHLYVLHRGDTSAKVQNIAFSLDSRWVAISTLRGTTHVFPITPYGGAMGVRTHTSLHVVNKLSRFHRSAGLSADGRSSSPISHSESTTFVQSLQPYHNPTLPPFPRPTVVLPLAQLRQPFVLGSPPGSVGTAVGGKSSSSGVPSASQRQRLSSLSDDNGKPLSVCAMFAKSRSWLLDPPNVTREAPHRIQRKAVDSLFVMAGHGALIQYDLDTKLASNVAKEKICDDTPIELEVEAKAQWNLGRRKDGSQDIMPPLSVDNWLIKNRNSCMLTDSTRQYDEADDRTESWLSQVEIITHAGPHRRLWMGPQFVFKTYNAPSGSNLNHVDAEAVEIGISKTTTTAAASARVDRSSPLNMPLSAAGRAPVPVLIESGSYSSIEQSPKLMDRFRHDHLNSDFSVTHGDTRLKEDLADAMRESPSSLGAHKESGRLPSEGTVSSDNAPFYDALTEHEHERELEHETDVDDGQPFDSHRSSSAVALAHVLPNICSYDTNVNYESLESMKKPKASIEKVVNPLGTVTTVTSVMTTDVKTDILDEVVSQLAAEDCIIHENCDEALFRPVVAIFCEGNVDSQVSAEEAEKKKELCRPPEVIRNKLIVPVIAKEVDAELCKKEKQKIASTKLQACLAMEEKREEKEKSILSKKIVKEAVIENLSKPNKTITKEEKDVEKRIFFEKIESAVATEDKSTPRSKVEPVKAVKEKPKSNSSSEREVTKETPKPFSNIETAVELEKKSKLSDKAEAKEVIEKYVPLGGKQEKQTPEEKTKVSGKMEKIEITADILKPGNQNTKVKETDEKPSPCKNKQAKSEDSTEEKPIEFKRMTPLPTEKTSPSKKALDKSTLKKSDEGTKKSEEPDSKAKKMSKENEEHKDKIIPLKNNKPETLKKEECKALEKETKKGPTQEEQKATLVDDNFDIKKSVKSPKKEVQTSAKPLEISISKAANSPTIIRNIQTATVEHKKDSNVSTNPKSVETKTEPTDASTKIESDRKDASKVKVKMEVLNVSHLEDSLIELKEEDSKPSLVKTIKSQVNEAEKTTSEKFDELELVKLVEPVEIFSPPKSTKKNKKLNKSGSSSEGEEIVEIKVTKTKRKSIPTDTDCTLPLEERKTALSGYAEESKALPTQTDKPLKTVDLFNEVNPKVKTLTETPKSPKKSATNVEKKVVGTSIKSVSNDEPKTKQTIDDTKLYEVKVITEQPTTTKSDAKSEGKKEERVFKNVMELKEPLESQAKKTKNKKITSSFTDDVTDSAIAVISTDKSFDTVATPPPFSAWRIQSGAEMINKNLQSLSTVRTANDSFPSLGKLPKTTKTGTKVQTTINAQQGVEQVGKLLPDLPTPQKAQQSDFKEPLSVPKNANKKERKSPPSCFDDFPLLRPLEDLPPLPDLEPLEIGPSTSLVTKVKSPKKCDELKTSLSDTVSLINFESPLQENPAQERKITPSPRGFNEKNLILALCGSLHYENETSEKKVEVSPTLSLTRSSSALGEQSIADYKSLTENDETYMSLEQSSQETNTTNTNTATTNEKLSSSPNSSASEEVIVMEEKKMSKKQRRKKMQQQLDAQKEREGKPTTMANMGTEDDEELRPLIGGMSDSQADTFVDSMLVSTHMEQASSTLQPAKSATATLLMDESFSLPPSGSVLQAGHQSTTTDSEGPMPATTSDDNICVMSSPTSSTPHKLKTKKLEHKINLIAAIEAATSSSSTSSAEESGVEAGSERCLDADAPLVPVAPTPILPLPQTAVAAQQNATKKKTKRRKR